MDVRPFLLAGRPVSTDDVREVTSPWDDRVVARIARPDRSHLEAAIAAAAAAAPRLARMPAVHRAELLEHAREALRARLDDVVEAIVDEAGKPVTHARTEVSRALDTFTDAAFAARTALGEVVPLDAAEAGVGRTGIVERVPVGPVAAITPYNFPLNLVAHKLAPAVAAGCPVVLKPASQTPSPALILGQILVEAGLPEGALSVLPLDARDTDPLVTDPRMRMLSFTGSAEVGFALKAKAVHAHVALELGGNAAVYVAEDADLDLAVSRVVAGGFGYAGQSCISVQRVFVHRSVHDDFVARLVTATKAVKVGDPRDPDVHVGPLLRTSDADRVEAWIREAVDGGARVLCGGTRQGRVIAPTVLADVDPRARVACEEVFGPVVAVWPVADDDEAFARIDDSPFGLQAGIFTRDVHRVLRAWRELHVGGVVHDDASSFRVDLMPYGGTRRSGLGREGPRNAVLEMTEPRILILRG